MAVRKILIVCNEYTNLGYAFVQPQGDGTPGLFRDLADGVFKAYDPKFVVAFPPQMPAPHAAVREIIVPDKLPSCVIFLYEIDPVTLAPEKVFDVVAVASDPVDISHVSGRTIVVTVNMP